MQVWEYYGGIPMLLVCTKIPDMPSFDHKVVPSSVFNFI